MLMWWVHLLVCDVHADVTQSGKKDWTIKKKRRNKKEFLCDAHMNEMNQSVCMQCKLVYLIYKQSI